MIFKLGANVTLEQADYEEIEFAGGQAIDMTAAHRRAARPDSKRSDAAGREARHIAGDASGRAGQPADACRRLSAFCLKEGDSIGA
ncbi:MAG: hypothetical protein ACLUHE_06305 [Christensenellales bacterium]